MPPKNKGLYVKQLSASTTVVDLKRIFGEAGKIQNAWKVSTRTALISFYDANHAQKAIDLFHGSSVDGSSIHVEYKTSKKNVDKQLPVASISSRSSSRSSSPSSHRSDEVQDPPCSRVSSDICFSNGESVASKESIIENQNSCRGRRRKRGRRRVNKGSGKVNESQQTFTPNILESVGSSSIPSRSDEVPDPLPKNYPIDNQISDAECPVMYSSQSSINESPSTDYQPMDIVKLRYMLACNLTHQLIGSLSVTIHIDLENSKVVVKGNKVDIQNTLSKMKDLSDQFTIITSPVSEAFAECFTTIDAKEIIDKFKNGKVQAGWDLCKGNVRICSSSLQGANLALELVQQLITEVDYPMTGHLSDGEIRCVTTNSKWVDFMTTLKREYELNYPWIHYVESSKQLRIALRASAEKSRVVKDLQKFLEPYKFVQEYLSFDKKIRPLILKHKDYYERLSCQEGVTMHCDPPSSSKYFILESQFLESVNVSKNILTGLVSSIASKSCQYQKPGEVAWLKSSLGKTKLQDISTLSQTVVSKITHRLRRRQIARLPSQTRYSRALTPSPPPRPKPHQSSPPRSGTSSNSGQSGSGIFSIIMGFLGAMSTASKTSTPAPAQPKPAPTFNFSVPSPSVTPPLLNNLKIVSGDISKIEVDGLVSSQGAIERSILSRAISGYHLSQGLQSVILEDEYNYASRHVSIFHLQTPSWNGTDIRLKELQDQIRKAFEGLDSCQSIAVPVIGTGGLGYPPEKVATVMIGTLLDCMSKSTMANKKVTIVVYPAAYAVKEAFQKEYSRYKPVASAPDTTAPVFQPTEETRLTFRGIKMADVEDAFKRVDTELKHSMSSTDWLNYPQRGAIGKLTQQEVDDIYEKAIRKNLEIRFELDKQNIWLEGLKDDVTSMKEEINLILHKKSTSTLPSHWDQTEAALERGHVSLEQGSEEYEKVMTKFRETSAGRDLSVIKIHRIQNEELYTQYEAQKNKVKKELKDDRSYAIETQLWHGTSVESTKQICAHGFNRSYAGKNGVAYGQGTYFSTTSNYSTRYCSGQGEKCLILAKVVTGRYKLGNSSTTTTNLPTQYHSTTNSQHQPTIFVVYHDAAAYPEYVIHFWSF